MSENGWLSTIFIVLRHPEDDRILLQLVPETEGWQLPSTVYKKKIEVSSAGVVSKSFSRLLKTEIWTLRQFYFAEDEGLRETAALFEVELLDPAWETPIGARWVRLEELDIKPFGPAGLHREIQLYLDNLGAGYEPPERVPWSRAGWQRSAREWIRSRLAENDLELRRLEQVKQWGISTVLRAKTDHEDFYFKAPSPNQPLFVNEAQITETLANLFPGQVPPPIITDIEQDWMLMRDFGKATRRDAPVDQKEAFFRQFAAMQIESIAQVNALLEAGCLDRRTPVLIAHVEELMESPTARARMAPEEMEALSGHLPRILDWIRKMDDYKVPATLVHGDLHLGNTVRRGEKYMVFDWTDACIAHPFIDLFVIAEEEEEADRLLSAYLEAWLDYEPLPRLAELWQIGRIALNLHQAVSFDGIVRNLEPDCVPELNFTHYFLLKALAHTETYLEQTGPS